MLDGEELPEPSMKKNGHRFLSNGQGGVLGACTHVFEEEATTHASSMGGDDPSFL